MGTKFSKFCSLSPWAILACRSARPFDLVVASRLRMFLRITMRSGDREDKSCGATVVDSGDVGMKDPNDPSDLASEEMDTELDTS